MWELISQTISIRSFSSIWYWIVVGLFWMLTTRQAMGLPIDLIDRARSGAGLDDLQLLAQVQAQRLLRLWRKWQVLLAAFGALLISLISVLGFGYGVEFAQAVWFLAVPMAVIAGLTLRTAGHVLGEHGQDELLRLMYYLRLRLQLLAIASVFVTVVFAMLQFLRARYFG